MVTVIGLAILSVGQFFLAGYGVYKLLQPSPVSAQSYSTTLTTAWDRTGTEDYNYADLGLGCEFQNISYSCYGASTRLDTGFSEGSGGGTICPSTDTNYRSGMQFSLSSIPNAATITNVELLVTVFATTANTVNIGRGSTDNGSGLACSDLFNDFMSSTYTTTSAWNTSGLKTIDLGATADSDVQTRLSTTDNITISFGHIGADIGTIDSLETANPPQLRVTYTAAPPAPTGFASTGKTDSTMTWGWSDTATAETRYDVHTAAHSPVTGCTNLAANTQSCTETGLSANTQYTRHANVTDANGNTDSTSASAYTAIETPAGISFSGVTATSITAASSTSLSNLSTGSSGVYFQENSTSTNSGWLTTNSWTKSSLTANTQYAFQVKARNGDAVETSLTSAASKYTLAAAADVTSARTTSTWYTTSGFDFTNAAGWGSGGLQYYRYVWDQQTTHVFTGTESTWSSINANCPGGTCTTANTTLGMTATSDANTWYLHVLAYNGEDVATGSGTNLGPYYFDGTGPTTIASVHDGTGADETYSSSPTTLSANWTTATDAVSGLAKYQYAIGITSGGSTVVDWTDNGLTTSVTNSSLTLNNQTTYYVSVRSVDTAGNLSAVTSSNGITVIAQGPVISAVSATPATTGATIVWTTDTPASSAVEYGLSATYGTSSGTDATLVAGHQVALANLTAGTTYHYRVLSTDIAGNTSASADGQFTTTSLPTAPSTPTSTIAPPTITNWHDGDLTADTTPTIAGTGPARGGVFIVVDRKLVRTAAVNSLGLYSIDLQQPLSLGAHAIVVRAKDRQGNVSNETTPITLTVVTPSTATRVTERLVTDGQRPTIKFTLVSPANSTISVYLDAHVVKRIDVGEVTTRQITLVPSTSLSYGRHAISFVTYDQQGIPSLPSGITSFTKSTLTSQKNVQVTYRPATTYVVQAGDSLWSIAQHLLGSGQRWAELQRLNTATHPSLVTTPSVIHVGWTLQIPAT